VESQDRGDGIGLLVDNNMIGDARLLFGTLSTEGWTELFNIKMYVFADFGLDPRSNDRQVWRFVQEHRFLLLTYNRKGRGDDALDKVIHEEGTENAFPVITIGDDRRMLDSLYRSKCAERLAEVIADLDQYLGGRRLYIP
jgi:hypothetical protein